MSLKDIKPREHKVNIAGKDCRLQYSYKAHAYIQEQTGKTREQIKELLFNDDLEVKDEITIIMAGLLKYHPEIKRADVEGENPIALAKSVIPAYLESILPPEIVETIYIDDSNQKKKTIAQKIRSFLNIPVR